MCPSPIDVFKYYPPATSRYCRVEQGGNLDKSQSDKVCSSQIKIGAEIGIPEIIKATFDYVRSHCTNENNAEVGKAATAGDRGAATSRGTSAVGENGLAVARGNNVKVKGGLGALLVIAEEFDGYYGIKEWKAVIVDGEKVKADTWYELQDEELIEVE